MTDSTHANPAAAASKDFNQFRDTINNLENNKITQDQATKAFQTEFAQMSKNGDNDNVNTLMANEFQSKNTLKDFPNLKIDYDSSSNSYKFSSANPKDAAAARVATVCLEDGDVSILSGGESAKLDTAAKYIPSILATAKQYMENGTSIDSTTKQLDQEMAAAKAAGVNFTDPKIADMVMKGSNLQFNALYDSPGKFAFTDDSVDSVSKRIFIDTNSNQAQVENLHLEAKAWGSALLRDTTLGATIGACLGGGVFTVPGAIIGGTLGLGAGLVEGAFEDNAILEKQGSGDNSILGTQNRSFFSHLIKP
jgi:hypothetical protein